MKKIMIIGILVFLICDLYSQTLIGTSYNPEATSNHNQRKIVRDSSENIYVVFTDTANQESIIKGVKYETSSGLWNNATFLFNGNNPTLSISKSGQIHLTYESNDSISKIGHTSTYDFTVWTPTVCLSDSSKISILPVADVDSSGKLNVFWIEKNGIIDNSLIYANVVNDSLSQRVSILTKNEINDIAIANHLQYVNDELIFAIQFNVDSILFLRTNDNMFSIDTLYEAIGSQPCITYNSFFDASFTGENMARFLYIDDSGNLIEVEYDFFGNTVYSTQLLSNTIDYVCIDDLAPPIGYSYLFLKNDNLYHGFSYGMTSWGWSTFLDTIISSPINPSIAYKTFNFFNIDYIWMENVGSHYNIYYKRDPKHIWVGVNDIEKDKGFSITGYPNPFSELLTIKLTVSNNAKSPIIKIYNSNAQLVEVLEPISIVDKNYEYQWDGLNQKGEKVNTGIYLITCVVGNKTTVRKVAYISR